MVAEGQQERMVVGGRSVVVVGNGKGRAGRRSGGGREGWGKGMQAEHACCLGRLPAGRQARDRERQQKEDMLLIRVVVRQMSSPMAQYK